jgi:peptide chain release factor subunit 1
MLVNDVDHDRLRRLADLHPEGAKVLSLYLDRDPETFASPRALVTEAHSLLDEAARKVEDAGLDHDALVAARADVERLRETLLASPDGARDTLNPDLDLKGARALALFACGPADLLEVLKLPAPVDTRAVLDDSPCIEPLVRASAGRERIAVAIVDRETARIFHGTADAIEEVEDATASKAHAQVRPEDAHALFKAVSDDLLDLLQGRGFDLLVLDAREELRGEVESALHPYVRERLAGEVRLDISSATPDEVRRAAAKVLEERRERHVGELLARLREGLGRGERAAAGLEDVRSALEQRRVEALIYEATRELPRLDDLVDAAVLQDAEVLTVDPAEHPELGPHEGIGAVLRF